MLAAGGTEKMRIPRQACLGLIEANDQKFNPIIPFFVFRGKLASASLKLAC